MEYLVIIGVGVSLLMQVLKKYSTSTMMTYVVLFILSVLGATIYYFLAQTSYWTDIVKILTIAGAFHNFVIRRFEEK